MGRVQSVAVADGAGDRNGARRHGRHRASRGCSGRYRADGLGGGAPRIQYFSHSGGSYLAARDRRQGVQEMKTTCRKPLLDRREVVAEILKSRNGALVVTGLGAPSWDTAAAGDDALNFYTWGGMGGAAMVGLGLAIAQPKRRVLIITGDG